jgi:hypothetical protein
MLTYRLWGRGVSCVRRKDDAGEGEVKCVAAKCRDVADFGVIKRAETWGAL